jgi:hypothetical protein
MLMLITFPVLPVFKKVNKVLVRILFSTNTFCSVYQRRERMFKVKQHGTKPKVGAVIAQYTGLTNTHLLTWTLKMEIQPVSKTLVFKLSIDMADCPSFYSIHLLWKFQIIYNSLYFGLCSLYLSLVWLVGDIIGFCNAKVIKFNSHT